MKRLHTIVCLLAIALTVGGCGGGSSGAAALGSGGSISGGGGSGGSGDGGSDASGGSGGDIGAGGTGGMGGTGGDPGVGGSGGDPGVGGAGGAGGDPGVGGSGGDPGVGGAGGNGGAAAIDWVPTGGPGGFGSPEIFATSSGVLLASENQLLMRSTDGGFTWTSNAGLPLLTSRGYISEANGTLFASTGGNPATLHSSTDDGATWSVLQTDWRRSIPVAGPRGELWAWETSGEIYSSNDGGLTWTFETGGWGNDIHAAGGKLYALLLDAIGVWDGAAWSGHLVQVSFDQLVEHGGSLFAIEYAASPIHRSDDGGATWVVDDPFGGANRCPFGLADGTELYVGGATGFFRRDTTGWVQVGAGVECPRAAGGGGVWAFDEMTGVLSRFDAVTADWATIVPQTSNTQLISLVGDDDVLFTLDRYGRTWRSTDEGATWVQTSGPGVRDAVRIGAASWVGRSAQGGEIIASTDDGATWQALTNNPAGIAGGIAAIGSTVYVGSGSKLFSSTDGGATWTELQHGVLTRISKLFTDGSVLYVVGDETWRSTDGGATFASVSTTRFETGIVRAGSDLIGWAPGDGIWSSSDDGLTWQQVQAAPPVAIGPFVASGTDLFVASMSFTDPTLWKVWYSDDLGLTWTELGSLLPAGPTALRATSSGLYVALDGAGVWTHPLP